MRKVSLICFLLFTAKLVGQNLDINSQNYYNYLFTRSSGLVDAKGKQIELKGKVITTTFLTDLEATPIIIEELQKAGYQYPSANAVVKIDSTTKIVVSAFVREKKFGIIYIQGHFASPKKENRGQNFSQLSDHYDLVQAEENISGGVGFIKIKYLPSNIFSICEDWYWYQYSDNSNDNKSLVSKEDAKRILREDIKSILKNLAKPVMQRTNPFIINEKN